MQAIFLDLETTGLDPYKHSVIEIALKIIDLPSGSLKGSYHAIIKLSVEAWSKRDPASIEINGFSWNDVRDGIDSKDVSRGIIELFQATGIVRGKAVFICQNPSFDRAFFMQLIDSYTQEKMNWPYHWLDLASMFWAVSHLQCAARGEPFPETIIVSKNEIARIYSLPPETEPHKAMNGVDHLIMCYEAVLIPASS